MDILQQDLTDLKTIDFVKRQLDPATIDRCTVDLRSMADDLLGVSDRLHLRTIIGMLADSAFQRQSLSEREFITALQESKIIEFFTNTFLRHLQETETTRGVPPGAAPPEDVARVQNLLRDFLSNYARNDSGTLFDFLEGIRTRFPAINLAEVFDDDMRYFFQRHMLYASGAINHEKFEQVFNRNPDKFVLDFILSRVISIDEQGTPTVDPDLLQELFSFLFHPRSNGNGVRKPYDLERVYLLLYERFLAMTERVGAIRDNIREAVPEFLPGDVIPPHSLFSPEFDFHAFFEMSIEPAIAREYERALPEYCEIFDAVSTDPNTLLRAVIPDHALDALRRIADLDERAFGDFVRAHFNYVDMPAGIRLEDTDIVDILSYQLADCARMMRYLHSRPFEGRDARDGIHARCKFLPEIVGEEDEGHDVTGAHLHDLYSWAAYPERFFTANPDRLSGPHAVSAERVAYESRLLLQLFYFYRKHIFDHAFQEADVSQAALTEHLTKRLHIEPIGNETEHNAVTFEFRILQQLDPETGDPLSSFEDRSPVYVVARPETLPEFHQDPENTVHVHHDGSFYRMYPLEKKKLTPVRITVPLSGQEPVSGTLWIYTPDGETIGRKKFESFLESWLRGKTPGDSLRTTFVTNDGMMVWALKKFFYEGYCSDASITKIQDKRSGRSAGKPSATSRSGGSRSFANKRDFSAGNMYYTSILLTAADVETAFRGNASAAEKYKHFLKVLQSHRHIGFEVQIMDLELMFLQLSVHTDVSHERYGPERLWNDGVIQRIFSPIIYDDEVARDLLGGFRGKPLPPANDDASSRMKVTVQKQN